MNTHTAKNWKTGDLIDTADLNRMEQSTIPESNIATFNCNFISITTVGDQSGSIQPENQYCGTLYGSANQIMAAKDAGKLVQFIGTESYHTTPESQHYGTYKLIYYPSWEFDTQNQPPYFETWQFDGNIKQNEFYTNNFDSSMIESSPYAYIEFINQTCTLTNNPVSIIFPDSQYKNYDLHHFVMTTDSLFLQSISDIDNRKIFCHVSNGDTLYQISCDQNRENWQFSVNEFDGNNPGDIIPGTYTVTVGAIYANPNNIINNDTM